MSGERLFQHRLALALGMTVTDLLARMSASEYEDWKTFSRQEMIREERAWRQHGLGQLSRREPEASPEEFARAVGAI